jgi:hypothetical protein
MCIFSERSKRHEFEFDIDKDEEEVVVVEEVRDCVNDDTKKKK